MRLENVKPIFMVLGIAITSVLAISVQYAPSSASYSIYNPDWDGLSNLIAMGVRSITDYSTVIGQNHDSALLIIPRLELDQQDVNTLLRYLRLGGMVIIADDRGIANSFLRKFGIEIVDTSILDPVFNYRSPKLPLVYARYGGSSYVVVLNVPTYLKVFEGGWRVIGRTSIYAFTDLDGDGVRDVNEPRNSFITIACREVGQGRLCVISDPDLFINSMLYLHNNTDFLKALTNGRRIYLDIKHLGMPLLDVVRYTLFGTKTLQTRVVLISLLIALSMIGTYLCRLAVIQLNRVAILFAIYISILTVFSTFICGDLPALALAIAIPIALTLRRAHYVLPIATASTLYLGREPLFIVMMIPIALVYPRMFRGVEKQFKDTDFFGSSSRRALRVLSIYIPALMVELSAISIYLTILSSLLIQCLWRYVELGRIKLKTPSEVVKGVLGRDLYIQLLVETPKIVHLYVELQDVFLAMEVRGRSIVAIPYRTTRLGFQSLQLRIVVEDLDGVAARRYRLSVAVNVIPTTRIAIEILESSLAGLIESVGIALAYGRGGVGMGIRGRGSSGGVGRGVKRFIYIDLYRNCVGIKKSRVGEYIGVREYVPGDDIRSIHWKKSVSRNELIVKEYSSGGGGGGRGSLITFADLTACNPIELDRLSYALVSYLAYRAMVDPYGEALLFLTLPDGSTEVIHGRNLDVLASVVHIFANKRIFTDYSYESLGRSVDDVFLQYLYRCGKPPLSIVKLVNEAFVNEVLDILNTVGIAPNATYTLIYGKPTALKYSYLRFRLRDYGYRYVPPLTLSLEQQRKISSMLQVWIT